MLKVLLVDDEPFIAQGLSVLIDWEKWGYEIAGMVYNGKEALDFLKTNEVDLILADVKMPVMDGITLLKKIREESVSEAFFVIVSGYGEFSYAQQAIKYKCTDYILKPVQKEQLSELLERVNQLYNKRENERSQEEKMKQAYFARYMQSILLGRGDREAVEYISQKVEAPEGLRYVCLHWKAEKRLWNRRPSGVRRKVFMPDADNTWEMQTAILFLWIWQEEKSGLILGYSMMYI